MRKAKMEHPKLYLSAERIDSYQIDATYVSNRFGPKGKLIEQVIEITGIDKHMPIENVLFDLNKAELNNLELFIARQEKVVSNYEARGQSDQFRIVSDSLKLLIQLQATFENWFDEIECVI
jgi:hypothetical protein